MDLAVMALLFFAVFGSHEQTVLSPAVSVYGVGMGDNTPCRNYSAIESHKAGLTAEGKQSRSGMFVRRVCSKNIFNFNERPNYHEFVVATAERFVPRLVNGVLVLRQREELRGLPVFCDLSEVENPTLAAHLNLICQSALAGGMGSRQVLRLRPSEGEYLVVSLELNETASSEYLFQTKVAKIEAGSQDPVRWMGI